MCGDAIMHSTTNGCGQAHTPSAGLWKQKLSLYFGCATERVCLKFTKSLNISAAGTEAVPLLTVEMSVCVCFNLAPCQHPTVCTGGLPHGFTSVFLLLHSISVSIHLFLPVGFVLISQAKVRWLEINRGWAHTKLHRHAAPQCWNCWAGEFHPFIFCIQRQHHPCYRSPRWWIDFTSKAIVGLCV